MRGLVALLSVVTALVVTPALAQAEVVPVVGGNAYFTNSATDTVWMVANTYSYASYKVHVRYYTNGVYTTEDWTNTFTGTGVSVKPSWPGTLTNGVTYEMCGTGEFLLYGYWYPDVTGTCDLAYAGINMATTIDRSKPTVSNVSVEGAATYSNKSAGQSLSLAGVYSDSISPPWPAAYTCVRTNADPATACNGATYGYQAGCSNAQAGAAKTNNPFSCTYPIQAGDPDGPLVFCAMVADSSVPDNPLNANPYAGFTSSNANISNPSCGYVILDRAAPTVTIGGGATSASTGDVLAFSASAIDPVAGRSPGSGPTGVYTWNWGDGSANGTGVNATHAYAQAGTFTVTMTTADNAGNTASATRAVTIAQAAGSGAIKAGPGGSTGGAAGGAIITTPTAADITAATGTRATQVQSAGGLDVLTARTVKITRKLKALPLALTAHETGAATFALVLGGRIVSQTGLQLTKAGSLGLSLKLPKRITAGSYRLKVTFTPSGARTGAAKTIGIRFSGRAAARAGAVQSVRAGTSRIDGGAPALPGLGTPAAPAPARGAITPS